MSLTLNITLPGGVQNPKKMKKAPMDFDLEAPPELGLLPPGASQKLGGRGEEDILPRTPSGRVGELESWVTWRALMHDMPGWWEELAKVSGVDDHEKLAWEVWASFQLP